MNVYAHNPETGETELKEVVRTFVRESNELVHISVNGEEIISTPTHPFWVPVKGWTKAIQLRAGDRLQLLNGEYVVIEQVQHELLESPVKVYNFEVEGFHTYFVGYGSVLVHNTCTNDNPLDSLKYSDKVKSQMDMTDNHGFPRIVDNYGGYGRASQITGGDGLPYIKVQIPGSYNGYDGMFEYIFDLNMYCNHRVFIIKWPGN